MDILTIKKTLLATFKKRSNYMLNREIRSERDELLKIIFELQKLKAG